MNKEIAQALREAQLHLWDGHHPRSYTQHRHICFALWGTAHPHAQRAIALVMGKLDGATFEYWWSCRCRSRQPRTFIEWQAARHQWLDELIAELESVS